MDGATAAEARAHRIAEQIRRENIQYNDRLRDRKSPA
jgi:hypothetical protein